VFAGLRDVHGHLDFGSALTIAGPPFRQSHDILQLRDRSALGGGPSIAARTHVLGQLTLACPSSR